VTEPAVTAGRTPTPKTGADAVGGGPSGGRPSAPPTEDFRATAPAPVVREVATPHGPARVTVHPVPQARAVLLLGHGAGGGFAAPDLRAATSAAQAAGLHVAHVEQPYRVAGRRAPAPAAQLDTAWTTVVAAVRAALPSLPLLVGGRSSGARVACRTASATGALAVVCLAFPVHPPSRPEKDRLTELAAPTVPVLVVQGERDPFGRPPPAPGREVVLLAGDHTLKADLAGLSAAVTRWLEAVVSSAPLLPAPLLPAPLLPAPLSPAPLSPAPLSPAPLSPAPLSPPPR
jgi:predicted alpha/beta-hydrolase family hydrolase